MPRLGKKILDMPRTIRFYVCGALSNLALDFWMHFNNNSIEILSSDFTRMRHFSETYNTSFNDMFDTVDFYAFDGGLTRLGETVFMSTSSLVFANHACDHKPNFASLTDIYPFLMHAFWEQWNPLADRFRSEINHITIATRDVKRGEMITDDYTSFDGFMTDEVDEIGMLAEIKEWCGETA
jgi:hypothetical protein